MLISGVQCQSHKCTCSCCCTMCVGTGSVSHVQPRLTLAHTLAAHCDPSPDHNGHDSIPQEQLHTISITSALRRHQLYIA